MDARELAVVIAGLIGTFCLPWPLSEPDEMERAVARIVSEGVPAPGLESALRQERERVPAALCGRL